jgi:NitT/TauT family transport system ATP-binding protein
VAPAVLAFPPAPIALQASRLTIDYEGERGPVRAVEAVDFTVRRGDRLVLLGPSGCGKSSVLKAVAGFLQPTGGAIQVYDRPVTGPGPDRIVVFQEFDQLLPWKTVIENVAFPLRVARKLGAAEARARAGAALGKVGLDQFLDAYPHTLSGGMKQRVAIARALATAPDILLMDEPFAALDALTRRRLQADLLALAEELRFTLLFVTHAIDEAVVIGTSLHLLSARPGRTIATFDTSTLGLNDVGGAVFEAVARDVHGLLFGRDREAPNV